MERCSLGRKSDAATSYRGQKSRCENPNDKSFKYYGGKGIKVMYTRKEFYPWYVKEAERFKKTDKLATDRIDHDKNYCFENIQLVLRGDNIRESNARRYIRDIYQYNLNGEVINTFQTFAHAARETGIGISSIIWIAKNNTRSIKHNCYFRDGK